MKNIFVVLAFFVASVFNVSFAQEQLTKAELSNQIADSLFQVDANILDTLSFNKIFLEGAKKKLFKILYSKTKVNETDFEFGEDGVFDEVFKVKEGYIIYGMSSFQIKPFFFPNHEIKELLRK